MSSYSAIDSKNSVFGSTITAESVHVGDTRVSVGKPVFSDIDLGAYDISGAYVSPRFTGRMVSEIMGMKMGRMVAITGFYGFDKAGFTKHLAFKLAEEWERAGKAIAAKECLFTSDYFGIAAHIKETKEDCIFVLNNITPKDVNHNLAELRGVALSHPKEIIILVSTDLPRKSWKDPNADYWFTIELDGLHHRGTLLAKEVYSKNDLLRYLLLSCAHIGLAEYKDKLKEVLSKLIPGELDTPEQISLFLDFFAKAPSEDEKTIREQVAKTKQKDRLISQWFNSLDESKRLIVLGMTLLEGVYDDQFFPIMQRFVDEAWQPFPECPAALDYADLNPLLHFFSFTSGESSTLEAKFPNQRYQTLLGIWENYRRRITATLPLMVKLAAQSVEGSASSWELFGDKRKRSRLRDTIAEVFSDIGRFSPLVVEPWLLQLAVHENAGVQMVAAKAMARWREAFEDPAGGEAASKEAALFELLKNWHEESRQSRSRIAQARALLNKDDTSRNSPTSYVRATILLTLGFASAYDESNALHKEIFDLVKKFAKDQSFRVINRLQYTLRLLRRNHPRQVGDRLFDFDETGEAIFNSLLPLENYAYSIAFGLADAHVDYPADVEDLLEEWFSYCRINRPRKPDLEKLSFREKILCTVAITYKLLDYDQTVLLKLDQAADNLDELRQNEHHPLVRPLLLEVILSLYERYFDDMEARHSKSIPNMDVKERKRAAFNLLNTYLYERSQLAGGDYEVEIKNFFTGEDNDIIKGQKMESWRNLEDRPLTGIEEVLKKWLASTNETLMKIALQAFIEFSKIEVVEQEKINDYLDQKEGDEREGAFKLPAYDDNVRKGLWANVLNFFGAGNKIRDNLSALIKEDPNMGKEQMEVLKEKLSAMGIAI